jgi:predicted O-methyltransferase YrrM
MIARIRFWVTHPLQTLERARFKLFLRIRGLPAVALAAVAPDDPRLDAPIVEHSCMPPFVPGRDHDDYSTLLKIVKTARPNVLLELGTGYGNTVANICREVGNVRVWTVNAPPEKITGNITTYVLNEQEIGHVYREHGFADRVTQILENTLSLDLARYFSEACVDLAIIDACHDTEYVLNDFSKVEPFVRPGGIVLFHDTAPWPGMHTWGSYTACMELRRKGFDVRWIQGTWWGVWRKAAPLLVAAPARLATAGATSGTQHA